MNQKMGTVLLIHIKSSENLQMFQKTSQELEECLL